MTCRVCQAQNAPGAAFCQSCGARLEVRPMEGERRFVTVLFADVVGSTAMGEILDPEQVAEIMNGAFARFNAAVDRYGGTVSRLMGDAVLAIFGAPVAHEDDAERAVRAALEIRGTALDYGRAIERGYGVAFDVRVGLHSGLAVLAVVGDQIKTEYTAMGDTANLAARLQSAAEPGTVLVSADTFALVRALFEARPRGALAMKGKSAAVEAYEILAARSVPGRTRGVEGLSSPLVGREAEMALLRERLDALHAGQGALVAVVGEAGLGKSRLAAEVRNRLADPAAAGAAAPLWLEGRALSYGQALPYFPWRQALRAALGAPPDATPEDVRARLAGAAADLGLEPADAAALAVPLGMGVAAAEAADADETSLAARVVEAVRRYLAALAARQPLVLLLDDLHWADTASIGLLEGVAETVASSRALLLAVLRPDRQAPAWGLLQALPARLGERFTPILLDPLDATHARELLDNLMHVQDLPPATRDLVLRKSDGNPFFIEEVLRSLINSGHIVRDGEHWRATRDIASVAIPDTLAGVLSARIDRLPEHTKRVAQTAAVLGRIFPYRALAAVCEGAPPAERVTPVDPHLGTLAHEELVRERARGPELEYIFKHALTQQAAYELLLLKRRRDLHRRAGESLERLYAGRLDELTPVLAHHFWQAEDWERAAAYAGRAGAISRRLLALPDALEHFQRAVQALERLPEPPPEPLFDAILTWVQVAYRLQRYDEMLRQLARAEEIARGLGDQRRLAEALFWIANTHILAGFPLRAMPALQESYHLAEALGDRRLGLLPLFAATSSMVDHDPATAAERLLEVIALAREMGNLEVEAHALASRALALARLGEFGAARAEIEQALEVAPRTRSVVKEADVHLLVGMTYVEMGQAARGREFGHRGAEQAMSVGALECATYGYLCLGIGGLAEQDTAAAEAAFERAVRLHSEHLSDRATTEVLGVPARLGLAVARAFAGRPGAVAEVEQALAAAQAMGDLYSFAFGQQALGVIHARAGDVQRAETYLQDALAYYRRLGLRPRIAPALLDLAGVYEAQGRHDEAFRARQEASTLALSPREGEDITPARNPDPLPAPS